MKIDLRNRFYNIRIAEGEEWKTTFRTRFGLFEYLVLPMGLTNSPATLQKVMNTIFRKFDHFATDYMDDILVFSEMEEHHVQHVKLVLQELFDNDLYAKPEKCLFHSDTVEYL
jgi:hypothetical protein